jgi:hypothetical protein
VSCVRHKRQLVFLAVAVSYRNRKGKCSSLSQIAKFVRFCGQVRPSQRSSHKIQLHFLVVVRTTVDAKFILGVAVASIFLARSQ